MLKIKQGFNPFNQDVTGKVIIASQGNLTPETRHIKGAQPQVKSAGYLTKNGDTIKYPRLPVN